MTTAQDPSAKLPIPDPTNLTTEQMLREVGNLETLMNSRMRGMRELFESQLMQMERQRIEQKQDTKAAVDDALAAAKEVVKTQTQASQLAIDKAEAANDKRMEASNDIRDAMRDQTGKFVLRSEAESQFDRVENDIKALRQSQAEATLALRQALSEADAKYASQESVTAISEEVKVLRDFRGTVEASQHQTRYLLGLVLVVLPIVIIVANYIASR